MKDFLKVYGPILLLIVAGFVVAWQFVAPAPPRHLRLAAGQPGGAYAEFAKRYQAALAQNGIEVEIVTTAGSIQNLALLQAPESGVDVAFVQGGTGDPDKAPELRSIASLYYEPVWLFVCAMRRTSSPACAASVLPSALMAAARASQHSCFWPPTGSMAATPRW